MCVLKIIRRYTQNLINKIVAIVNAEKALTSSSQATGEN